MIIFQNAYIIPLIIRTDTISIIIFYVIREKITYNVLEISGTIENALFWQSSTPNYVQIMNFQKLLTLFYKCVNIKKYRNNSIWLHGRGMEDIIMPYDFIYVPKQEYMPVKKQLMELINQVQNEVRNYITFFVFYVVSINTKRILLQKTGSRTKALTLM